MKHFVFTFIIPIMALFLLACDGSQGSQTELARKRRREKNEARNEAIVKKNEQIDLELLRQMVENEKAQCPKDVGSGITVQDVELKDSAMCVTCKCQNRNLLNAMDSGLKDDVRESIILSVCQNDNDIKRIQILKKTKTSIIYLFKNYAGKSEQKIVIPPEELPDSIPSEQMVRDVTRKMFVNNLNLDLPMQISDAMIQQKALINGDDIILLIQCDESMIDMDRMKMSANENKKNMLAAMKNDKEGMTFLNTVDALGCNIIYRYCGDKSKKTVDIIILKNEMK